MIHITLVATRQTHSRAFTILVPTFITTDAVAIADAFRRGILISFPGEIVLSEVRLKPPKGIKAFAMGNLPTDVKNFLHPDWSAP